MGFGRDDVDRQAAAAQGRRRLHRDKASADHNDAGVRGRVSENAPAVAEAPQRHDMRQIASGKGRSPRRGAGRKQQFRVSSLVAVGEPQSPADGVDLLNARAAMKVDADVGERMPGDREPVVAAGSLEVVLGEKRPVVGLVGLFGEDRYRARPAELAQRVGRREPGRAAANDRHRPEHRVALFRTARCELLGRPDPEAIPVDLDRVGSQGVESRSPHRLARLQIEAGMMPRATNLSVRDEPLVQRPGDMRAGRAPGLEGVAPPPDHDALVADAAAEDFAVGRGRDRGPLGQIGKVVALVVAHGVTPESRRVTLTR